MAVCPEPFVMAVPEALRNDLQQRLALTCWLDEIPGSGWYCGAHLAYVKELGTTGSTSTTGVLRSVSSTVSHSVHLKDITLFRTSPTSGGSTSKRSPHCFNAC
jgi:hypothetical protein